ncbi:Ig-like domain-containing protein, partial [Escherichia coli]|nr:Ig-like domain-containing protein [Escherichia coli]
FLLGGGGDGVRGTIGPGGSLGWVGERMVFAPEDHPAYVLPHPKAACAGNFNMTFQSDDVRVFSVQFSAYPDDEGVLGKMSGPKPVKTVSIKPESPTVKAGETVQLTAEITPADAAVKTGVWESETPEKATVIQTGLVLGGHRGFKKCP